MEPKILIFVPLYYEKTWFLFFSLVPAVSIGTNTWRGKEQKNPHKWALENTVYSQCKSSQYQSLSNRPLNASAYGSVKSNPALDMYGKMY